MVIDKTNMPLAQEFKPSKGYTSPYLRTETTASIVRERCPNSMFIVNPALSEYSQTLYYTLSKWTFPENRDKMTQCAIEAIDTIISKHPDDDILIVTHRSLIRVYAKHLNGTDLGPNDVPYLTCFSFTKDGDKITNITIE